MSRLLFAAARGARLQAGFNGEWYCVNAIKFVSPSHTYRIHPGDEHLQYGPVSTALREMSEVSSVGKPMEWTGIHNAAFSLLNAEKPYWSAQSADWLHSALFMLILAEALADEGL